MGAESERGRIWSEQVKVAGSELVGQVMELAREGTARRLIIRDQDGKALLEVSLTAGTILGGALVLVAPHLAALGAIAALLTHVTIEIVRDAGEPGPSAQKVPVPTEPPLSDDIVDEGAKVDGTPQSQGTE